MKKVLFILVLLFNLEAKEFALQELMSEGTVNTKVYKNQLVLINLWASWCNSCKREMPVLDALGEKFDAKKFRVITVNMDAKKSNATEYIHKLTEKLKRKPKMLTLYDAKSAMAKHYKANALPLSLLMKNGKVISSYLGAIDEKSEKALIKEIKQNL